MEVYSDVWNSSLGYIGLKATENGLSQCILNCTKSLTINPNEHIDEAKKWLDHYFKKETKPMNLALDICAGSDFQRQVWSALQSIPVGKTITYKAFSIRFFDEKKVRAVANAIAQNPLAIFIPCHRVIGSQGEMRGFAWGLDLKLKLLQFESNLSYGLFESTN